MSFFCCNLNECSARSIFNKFRGWLSKKMHYIEIPNNLNDNFPKLLETNNLLLKEAVFWYILSLLKMPQTVLCTERKNIKFECLQIRVNFLSLSYFNCLPWKEPELILKSEPSSVQLADTGSIYERVFLFRKFSYSQKWCGSRPKISYIMGSIFSDFLSDH